MIFRAKPARRRGLSLVELLAVSAILLLMAGMLGSLSLAVQTTSESQFQRGLTLQHGQVTLARIQHHVQNAVANEYFPGAAVFEQTVGTKSYPDTLVVWSPSGTAAVPNGLPRIRELLVYVPNPDQPAQLWEIRKPLDTRAAPALSDTTAWRVELADFLVSTAAERTVLTDLLRTVLPQEIADSSPRRLAAVRFEVARRPSAGEWAAFRAGMSSWDSVPFAQGIRGPTGGLSQTRVALELQLCPGDASENSRETATPFLGSAAIYFQLPRVN